MNKLYIEKSYKDKDTIDGYIYDRPLKDKLNNFRVYFIAERFINQTYNLAIKKRYNGDIIAQFVIDETYDGKMNLKNILYYVEQHIKMITQTFEEKPKTSGETLEEFYNEIYKLKDTSKEDIWEI